MFPTGGKKALRSAEVMAHMIFDAIDQDNEVFLLVVDDRTLEFAVAKGVKYFDLREYNYKLFTYLLRVNHLVNIDWLFSKLYSNLISFLNVNKIDVVLERHGIFNLGFILSRVTNCKYITSEKMSFPDLDYYVVGFKNKLLTTFPLPYYKPLIKSIERKSFLHADYILSKHVQYERFLIEKFKINPDIIRRYYAFVDKDLFRKGNERSSDFVATYIGSFDKLHSSENIVPIIEETSRINKDIKFKLIGGGGELESIKKEIECKGLQSVCEVVGRVNHDSVLKFIQNSTVCFETIWNDRVRRFGADSIKIYEYMACEKIIIASDLPGQIQSLKNNNAGVLVDPTKHKDVAVILNDVYHNLDKYKVLGSNARKLIEDKWNNKYTADVFRKSISEC